VELVSQPCFNYSFEGDCEELLKKESDAEQKQDSVRKNREEIKISQIGKVIHLTNIFDNKSRVIIAMDHAPVVDSLSGLKKPMQVVKILHDQEQIKRIFHLQNSSKVRESCLNYFRKVSL